MNKKDFFQMLFDLKMIPSIIGMQKFSSYTISIHINILIEHYSLDDGRNWLRLMLVQDNVEDMYLADQKKTITTKELRSNLFDLNLKKIIDS